MSTSITEITLLQTYTITYYVHTLPITRYLLLLMRFTVLIITSWYSWYNGSSSIKSLVDTQPSPSFTGVDSVRVGMPSPDLLAGDVGWTSSPSTNHINTSYSYLQLSRYKATPYREHNSQV